MAYTHNVCFVCRKSWASTFGRFYSARIDEHNSVDCPQCHGKLVPLGRWFKPPKQRNTRQWRKVEAIVAMGFDFTSCENYPVTLAGMPDFKKSYNRTVEGERLAKKFDKRK